MYGGEIKGERMNGFLGNKVGGNYNNFGFLLQLAAFAAVACSFRFIGSTFCWELATRSMAI